NNVFLINPNGVIITKTGTINANRFVASTSSMSDGDMKAFANLKSFDEGLSFSPVFKTHKAGNVVNMGNINTNDVLLIGNKVDIQGGKLGNEKSKTHLVGNKVFVDFGKSIIQSDYNFISALDKSHVYISSVDYYNNVNKYNKANFVKGNYLTNAKNIEKFVSIGSDIDWWHFAKGWNENEQFRNTANEYRLINSIDFGGNQGKNYANYCIDGLGCTSMIVGNNGLDNAFTKKFDGQGFTLKNINIDATGLNNISEHVGLFGVINGAYINNVNIDYMNGSIKSNGNYTGGFAGYIWVSTIHNITLNSMNNIYGVNNTGGFAGLLIGGESYNIDLKHKGNIVGVNNTGGFAGFIGGDIMLHDIILDHQGDISAIESAGGFSGSIVDKATLYNVILDHQGDISAINSQNGYGAYAGGFVGKIRNSKINDIILDHQGDISAINSQNGYGAYAGGFVGQALNSDFDNISLKSLNSIEKITAYGAWEGYAGGFAGDVGYPYRTSFSNIFIYFNPNITLNARKDSSGKLFGKPFLSHNTFLDNIHIYHSDKDLHSATADQNYWGGTSGKIQIHTYDDSTQNDAYKYFSSKADTIQKPILPSKPIDPDNPDSNVILSSDDLYQDTITNEIIADV
ncbi:filamentous hemagglutinin N-terminal domain-containing protein, partial [Campylobacter lari]|nr:filamentous hemagglutinin N-terminal domain-containing protein [Campylobacter lari]